MRDSGRRRGSVSDVVHKDIPPYTDRGRYHEYSDLPQNNLSRPRDHSRWSSLEEKGDAIVKDKIDAAGTRERLHNSSYYKSVSPGFDGLEKQKWSNTPDKQWTQPHRYGERRRSRSRGLEKSRSRSPGWGRGRNRVRDSSRSRSRSRSRSKGSIRGQSRSRSPFYDQGPESHCSHRWNDRKSGHGRSSQTCKDFVAGLCRRGSQCRFPHSDNVLRDDEPVDSDIAGRWKGKQEPGHGSKYHYDKAADKFSDTYYGENEPSRGRARGAVTCRDFVKGNCRYGESCRFSHTDENNNVDRSIGNVPVERDHRHNSNNAGRTLCKYFLAGNCRRDNCRFSHDTPRSGELKDRIHDKSEGETMGTLDELNAPLRDEPEKSVNSRRISKWGPIVDADMDLSEDVFVGRRGDDRWGHSEEDETKSCEHDIKGLNRDNYHSDNGTNDENSIRMVADKATVVENSPGESQPNQTNAEFRSQSEDKHAPHIPNQNLGGDAVQHYLSSPSANPHLSMTSGTHQYQEMAEHNRGPALESGVLYEIMGCRNSNGESANQEIGSTFCDKGQQMFSPIPNALKVDLNESAHVVYPSNMNLQINCLQSTIQHMPEPCAHSSFPVQAPNDQFTPLNTLPIHVSSVQSLPAVDVAKSFLADCQQNYSNSTRSLDQLPVLKNDRKARELLSSLSMINPQLSTLHQSANSKVENDDSEENPHASTQELEVVDNDEKLNMSSKTEADNNCSNRADDQTKGEVGNTNKDEKAIRLFKNALVDLVKDILKPKWKEGKMSREVHKSVVKKVVDKVTVTIQAEHVPNTQEKIEQYLSSNRPKISKLVQAYAERSLKTGS
ncbi:hypothetical protein Leryth_025746 [Lithospermum erythrorhizon]|nr:hypothetical protein Leryth_025746 [Lithospermum erythrorhizon]